MTKKLNYRTEYSGIDLDSLFFAPAYSYRFTTEYDGVSAIL